MSETQSARHLPCPFCGSEPGHLLGVKVFCKNDDCAIYDLPIDVEKWNGRGSEGENKSSLG